MKLSHLTAANTQQLQHTLNLNLLKSAMNTQAAQAISMLDEIAKTEQTTKVTSAPHLTLGNNFDIRG